MAQTVCAHQFQYSDEFKYLTSETGHKNNKIRECAGENTSSRGSLSPQPGSARVWSGSGKTVGPYAPLIPVQPAQAATRPERACLFINVYKYEIDLFMETAAFPCGFGEAFSRVSGKRRRPAAGRLHGWLGQAGGSGPYGVLPHLSPL